MTKKRVMTVYLVGSDTIITGKNFNLQFVISVVEQYYVRNGGDMELQYHILCFLYYIWQTSNLRSVSDTSIG